MPWTTSNRRAQLPREWAQLRLRVLRRDRYACQARDSRGMKCNRPANQCDHIERGDDHSMANLQALCSWHHARKSAHEGVEARPTRPTQARPTEPHPGDVGVGPPLPPGPLLGSA